MVLNVNNVSKSFGTNDIIINSTFIINYGEKVALVGANGAGKSTLFKIITGEETLDEGQVFFAKDVKIGYLAQQPTLEENKTVFDSVLEAFSGVIKLEDELVTLEMSFNSLVGDELNQALKKYENLNNEFNENNGVEYRSRIKGVLKGLAFIDDDYNRLVSSLSGGEKTRLELAKLLLTNYDLLLLDEPTNHLDIEAIEWLEAYIKQYRGAVFIISHDRYFLDSVVGKVIEIEYGKSKLYYGNFTDFVEQKEIDEEIAMVNFENQQKEIKRQQEVIRQLRAYGREKHVKRARSREKLLAKMDVLDRPKDPPKTMNFNIEPEIKSGYEVMHINDLSKNFGERQVLNNVSFDIYREEKLALIGANGVGKSTLIKIILENFNVDNPKVKYGVNVFPTYYDQEHTTLNDDLTIFEEIQEANPKLTNNEIRTLLATFVFLGDEVNKKIMSLSGGEKGRVSLAKIMQSKANLLILDEPTNHLDMMSKEVLENAINNYQGTVIYISHDRYFINSTTTRILELTQNGINSYDGDFDYYLTKKSEKIAEKKEEILHTNEKDKYLEQKQKKSNEKKRQRNIENLEKTIEKCEEKIIEIDILLSKEEVFTDSKRTQEIYSEKIVVEELLAKTLEEWERLISEE